MEMLGTLFFIFFVLPVICYLVDLAFKGVGNGLMMVLGFPFKVVEAYKKDGIKGLISFCSLLLCICAFDIFFFGLIGAFAMIALCVEGRISIYIALSLSLVGVGSSIFAAWFYVKYLYPVFYPENNKPTIEKSRNSRKNLVTNRINVNKKGTLYEKNK